MRTLTAGALAKITEKTGTEPIAIVEIDWGVGGSPKRYADRAIPGIHGRILQLGQLDNVVDILSATSSQEIPLILDDSDGSIKSIIDSSDIHERDVRIYQWFDGLALSDKFLLFAGKISSPLTWNEADRSFKFSAVSQIEDKEFGFSVEEGDFEYIPSSLIGKPWPVIFGKVLDVPALRVNQAVKGTTLCPVGIISGEDLHTQVPVGGVDCALGQSLAVMSAQVSFLNVCASAWANYDPDKQSQLIEQANDIRAQIAIAAAGRLTQEDCATTLRAQKLADAKEEGEGCNPVRILGGEDFPQNQHLTLNINGGRFSGSFNGDQFTITSRWHPENDTKSQNLFDSIEDEQCEVDTPAQQWDFSMDVPPGEGDFLDNTQIRRRGFVICLIPMKSKPSTSQVAQHFWADAGSEVSIAGAEPQYFIASITPGTVHAVKAWKNFNGIRRLVNVPNSLWSVQSATYGPITAKYVVTTKPLSSIEGQGWEDDIYVTYESSVGPNTVDILRYIIDNWTDLSYDTTSFNAVETALDPFPSNFAVLDRKNTLELIKEIAFQARCAVWVNNGVVHLKYLPEEPSSDQTITVSDIAFDQGSSVEVEATPTEDIITKMIIRWRVSYALEEENGPETMILRNNVKKYGTKTEEFDWYIYNQPDIIHKAATFWLIRKSNTWKKMTFRGYLNLLRLETFDTVTLDLAARRYVASESVKAIVEKADYDSASNTVALTCLVPVRYGEMTKFPLFWPKDASVDETWPTAQDIALGFAGGNGIGANATGTLPIGNTDNILIAGTVFVGGPNVVFRGQSDRGDRTPTDAGFSAQQIINTSVYADLSVQQNPEPDLNLNYIDRTPAPVPPDMPQNGIIIDIRKTRIIDSDNPNSGTSYLETIIKKIDEENDLVINTDAKFGDDTNTKPFDFEYDPDVELWIPGSAYLRDDTP